MKKTTTDNHDASEFVSPWERKEELKAGAKKFRIQGVAPTTFEARKDKPAQRVLVLELDNNRRYALSTKADLNVMIDAFGQKTGKWVGREITLYCDEGVMYGNDRVGGVRVRIPRSATRAGRAADIDEAIPTTA